MAWHQAYGIQSHSFTCGHCGNVVASNIGMHRQNATDQRIYICPYCDRPSYITQTIQIPGVAPGNDVKSLPKDIDALYREARNCTAIGSNTAAVLTCRKLLMNIAVEQGAPVGKSFIEYVEFLAASGYVSPKGRGWVDHIRKKGNEATHEIHLMSKEDAEDLISFTEMLLKFIFEFPNRVPASTP